MRRWYAPLSGCALLVAFVPAALMSVTLAAIMAITLATAALGLTTGVFFGGTTDLTRLAFDPSLPLNGLPDSTALFVFGIAWLQNIGLVVAAGALLLVEVPIRRRMLGAQVPWSAAWREGFALQRTTPRLVAVAAALGLTAMWAPSFMVQVVARFVSLDSASADLIGGAFATESTLLRLLGVLTIAVMVPFFEELLFRGFLWRLMEPWAPSALTLLVTTGLFAVVHGSSAHILGVMFTGFALGWLRLHSRSLWPSVVLHMVNNGLAACLILLAGDSSDDESLLVAGVLALIGGGLSLALLALARRWRAPLVETTAQTLMAETDPALS
jgi:hypothetical protein